MSANRYRWSLLIVAALFWPGIAPVQAQADDVVCFYEDAQFRGNRICAPIGEAIRRLQGFNDVISSITVEDGAKVDVCTSANFGGRCATVRKDLPYVGDRMNDRITSYRVSAARRAQPEEDVDRACLFLHEGYRGRRICRGAGETVAVIPDELEDAISSIRISGNVKVRICGRTNLRGRCQDVNENQAYVGDRWNDRISSFRVVRTSAGGQDDRVAADQACFYRQRGFRGRRLCLAAGETRERLPQNWDDQISSVRIGRRAEAAVCNRPGIRGRCVKITRDLEFVGNRLDDRISSIRVAARKPAGPQANRKGLVCFFENARFRGREYCIGRAGPPSLVPDHLNNRISSVLVPRGMSVVLCDGRRMNKACLRIDRDMAYVGDRWDNRFSSFRVEGRGQPAAGSGNPLENLLGTVIDELQQQHVGNNAGDEGGARPAVCFFDNPGYRGKKLCARYGDRINRMPQGWNDRITSVRLARNAEVEVCEHVRFGGRCRTFEEDAEFVGRRWDDRISSFRVMRKRGGEQSGRPQRPPRPAFNIVNHPTDRICFFNQRKYRGAQFCAGSGSVAPVMPDGWDNAIVSMRNYGSAIVQLCDDVEFGGTCRTYDRSNSSVGEFSRRTSSFKIWSK